MALGRIISIKNVLTSDSRFVKFKNGFGSQLSSYDLFKRIESFVIFSKSS